ncbi:MAG: trigger factor [Bacteroidales bacterium]|jgi:trigger factor|nr:trigger factor [Bacteroidales bacterium]
MNITQENKGQTVVVTMQITPSDYSEKVENTLKEYRKKVSMPGFRPGAVPMGMLKKTHGKYVLVEEVNKLISEEIHKYIQDNKLQVLGEPLPSEEQQKEINWDTDTEFTFTFEIATAPEIEVTLPKKENYYKIIATDAMIDEQIGHLTARFGSQEKVDSIEGSEFIKGVMTQQNAETPYVQENAMLLLSKVATESELDLFKGAKLGDIITFNPKKAFENETEIASMLSVEKTNAELINADYALEVKEILRYTKSEVNQSLFDKVFGEGAVASETEFRAKIKADFETRMEQNSDYKFLLDTKEAMLKTNKFDLPEAFLKRWLLETNKDNDKVTPEQIETEFPLFLNDLRWQLLSGKIVKDNNLQVNEADIKAAAIEYTRMQLAQYGMTNLSDEDLANWSKELIKDQKQAQQIFEMEQDKKLIAYLKGVIKLTETPKTIEEFNAMFDKK